MPILSNSKHELFAQALASGKGPTDAFEAAGFKRHSGNAARLSANESVRQRVEEIVGAAAERAGVTSEWIIDTLRENVDRAMQAVEVKRAGVGTGEYVYDGAVANKALELLGKHLGMFKDKIEHSGGVTVEVVNF